MDISTITAVASFIPWKQVLDKGPEIVKSAFSRMFTKNKGPSSLEMRVDGIETHEKEQSALIASIAEQLENTVKNVDFLITQQARHIESLQAQQKRIAMASLSSLLLSVAILLYLILKR